MCTSVDSVQAQCQAVHRLLSEMYRLKLLLVLLLLSAFGMPKLAAGICTRVR